jgi:hypothetical protein
VQLAGKIVVAVFEEDPDDVGEPLGLLDRAVEAVETLKEHTRRSVPTGRAGVQSLVSETHPSLPGADPPGCTRHSIR